MTMRDMVNELQAKAYRQGFAAGDNGRPISQLDWEDEFLPEYNRGYRDGKAARATRESN